jgi:glycine oxidase
MRVAVVGGGIMGCAVALELRDLGLDVVLLERAVPGAEASSAAAGMLGAQLEAHGPGPLMQLLLRARDGYGDWARSLEERTRIDVGYRASGILKVARSESEYDDLARVVAWQRDAGLRVSLLGARDARQVEPGLATDVLGAAHFVDDAQVEPQRLLRALIAATASSGVAIQSGATVHRVLVERERCVGVALDAGELRADATVLAAGSWSSLVPGIPVDLPAIRPARGQLIQLEERPPRMRSVVVTPSAYIVPRGDGRVVCGSTLEFVGFRREVTAGGVHAILRGALEAVPSLASAEMGATWCSFRPHSASDAPLMGRSTLAGLFLATGHHRNGILLAKVTAEAVSAAIFDPS